MIRTVPVSSLARWTREGVNALPICWPRRGAPYGSFTGDAGLGASPVSEASLLACVAVPPNRRLYGGASLLSNSGVEVPPNKLLPVNDGAFGSRLASVLSLPPSGNPEGAGGKTC